MPFKIKWEKQGSVTTYSGTVNIDEVFEADRYFNNDPRSDDAEYQIIDFSQAKPGIVDESRILHIAAMDYGVSHSIPQLNVAFITEDQYIKRLCNDYINMCKEMGIKWNFRIFSEMKSARRWALS